MKKIALFLLAISMIFALTACNSSPAKKEMTIAPSTFSDETQEVLKILDDEIVFFDFAVDETIKSHSVELWVYEKGEWVSSGRVYGNLDASKQRQRLAIRITDSTYDVFHIDESGHEKSSFKSLTDFTPATLTGSTRLTTSTPIETGKEIPLWVKLGTDKNDLSMSIQEDFRTVDCNVGVAVTVTFFDTEVE